MMPTQFALAFAMPYNELNDWLDWVNANAYSYFLLPMPSKAGSAVDNKCLPTGVRFISDVSYELLGDDHIKVTVQAELEI